MRTTDQDLWPPFPVSQQTTAELASYRQSLETALALDTLPPLYASRDELQKRLDAVLAEQDERASLRHGHRDHDVSGLTADELDQTRRELAASLALVRPDSLARVPIEAHMTAIDAELAERQAARD